MMVLVYSQCKLLNEGCMKSDFLRFPFVCSQIVQFYCSGLVQLFPFVFGAIVLPAFGTIFFIAFVLLSASFFQKLSHYLTDYFPLFRSVSCVRLYYHY